MSILIKRGASNLNNSDVPNKIMKHAKTKMFAIMMMYSGVGYFGMQRNVGFPTIEEDLLKALLDKKLINECDFTSPYSIRFQRASKTDKNVSAMGQVCSFLLPLEIDLDAINSALPPQIRIIDIVRTTNNFNAKLRTDHRVYRYFCPSFAFSDKSTDSSEFSNYRIDDERLKEINRILGMYKGTHNFHNFTSGRKPQDKSCRRYIIDMECGESMVRGKYEYVNIKVVGQSFMIHQIRKMIGLCIAFIRGYCDEEVLKKAFTLDKVHIPRAPGLGLILDRVIYDAYNRYYGDREGRGSIEFNKYEERIRQFSEKFIYSYIIQNEEEERSMETWLESLEIHSFDGRVENRVDDENSDDENSNKSNEKFEQSEHNKLNENNQSELIKSNEESNQSEPAESNDKSNQSELIKSNEESNQSELIKSNEESNQSEPAESNEKSNKLGLVKSNEQTDQSEHKI